jgi:hypothetical protein
VIPASRAASGISRMAGRRLACSSQPAWSSCS